MLISHRQPAHPHVGTYRTYAGLAEFSTELYCRATGARRLDPASERQGMAIIMRAMVGISCIQGDAIIARTLIIFFYSRVR
jgi:hypothetical protein